MEDIFGVIGMVLTIVDVMMFLMLACVSTKLWKFLLFLAAVPLFLAVTAFVVFHTDTPVAVVCSSLLMFVAGIVAGSALDDSEAEPGSANTDKEQRVQTPS